MHLSFSGIHIALIYFSNFSSNHGNACGNHGLPTHARSLFGWLFAIAVGQLIASKKGGPTPSPLPSLWSGRRNSTTHPHIVRVRPAILVKHSSIFKPVLFGAQSTCEILRILVENILSCMHRPVQPKNLSWWGEVNNSLIFQHSPSRGGSFRP